MTGAVLGALWAGMVLAGAAVVGTVPATIRGLAAAPSRPSSPLAVVGSAYARLLGRLGLDIAPDHASARRFGVAVTLTVPLAALAPGALLLPTAWAVVWPILARRRASHRRVAAVEADLPDVVDLLVLSIGSGLNVGLAVEAVGRRGTGPIASALAGVAADVRRGRPLADALEALPAQTAEAVHPLVDALVAGDRYGTPLLDGLERLAAEVRAFRRRRCEEASRKVPVQLLFPLVTCILPAFALLTVAPLVASALQGLRL